MFKFLKSLFSKSTKLETETHDEPLIIEKLNSLGYDEVNISKFYDVYFNDFLKRDAIKYIEKEIERIFSKLILDEDYTYKLVQVDKLSLFESKEYLTDLEIKRGFSNGEHIYLILAFKSKQCKQKQSDYSWDQFILERNLETGLNSPWTMKDWIKQDRNLLVAKHKHEFTFEYDLDNLNSKDIIFKYYKKAGYIQELKELIKLDLKDLDKIERTFIRVSFSSVSKVKVFIECDRWLIRKELAETDKLLESIIKKNINRLNVSEYFDRTLGTLED